MKTIYPRKTQALQDNRRENITIETVKLPEKEKENKKALKFALAGLAILGTAVAAGVLIYKNKPVTGINNTEKLTDALTTGGTQAQKTDPIKPAEVITEVAQTIVQKEEPAPTVVLKTEENVSSVIESVSTTVSKEEPATVVKKALTQEEREKIIGRIYGGREGTVDVLRTYNDEQLSIVEKFTTLKSYGSDYRMYPEHLEALKDVKDTERLRKISEVVSLDKRVPVERSIIISQYEGENFTRAIELTKRGYNVDTFCGRLEFETLSEKEFQRALQLLDSGVIEAWDIAECVKLDDKSFGRVVELCENYGVTEAHKIAVLPDEEYIKVTDRLKKGLPQYKVGEFDDEQWENFYMILQSGCDSAYIPYDLDLRDKNACLKFIEDFAAKRKGGITFEELSDPERLKEVIKAINEGEGYEVLKPDATLDQLIYSWKVKYVSGGGYRVHFSDSCETEFLRKSLPRYVSPDAQPLARWIYRDDLAAFIEKFPNEGETYAPGRYQSFAKTLQGAELYRGNNFSDSNLGKNVKFIVIPKGEVTEAFDMGQGKYGSDEVLYSAEQAFEVVKKGFETITNADGKKHRLYTIVMREK